MSPHLVAQLYERFPHVIAPNGPGSRLFEHGDGWNGILIELLTKLDLLRRTTGGSFTLYACKEKFAGLRTFVSVELPDSMSGEDRSAWRLVLLDIESAAMAQSGHTCEVSGTYGALHKKRDGGWLRTLSTEAAAKLDFVPFPPTDS